MNEANKNEAKLIYLHALTPVHVGTGQAVANVDLPIAREKATGFPIIPASAFKGVLRDYFRLQGADWLTKAFGSEPPGGAAETAQQLEAGDWAFTDLRILCLPVRSFYGTFAYTTCPLVLHRLAQVASALNLTPPLAREAIPVMEITSVALANQSALHRNGTVYLEDLDLKQGEGDATEIAHALAQAIFSDESEKKLFTERFAIVSDQVFSFLSETATEIAARVRLKEDLKTVERSALWYEEAVPAESLFYGFVTHALPTERQASFENLRLEHPIQLGGDATIGWGICRVVIVG